MTGTVLFDPLVPWPVLAVLAALAFGGVALALVRGLSGWALRGMAALVVIAALTGPAFQQEDRAPLTDIVIIAEDQSASQQLPGRPEQTATAADNLEAALTAREGAEVRRITVPDGEEDAGTRLMTALSDALAEEPRARVAGLIAISDGQVHDADLPLELPAPLHLLLTGRETDWDRRLIVKNAPAFAIIGEPVTLTMRIEDSGAAPADAGLAPLDISVDGSEPQRFNVRIGEDVELPVTLPHGGLNVIQFTVPEAEGELTDRNNTALIQMNGI
ncbi:MAG: hypothetical protein AAFU63_08670, partial [Pseudomonadota bacterium]